MFQFIFTANDLSDSHFRKKFITGMLIGRRYKKKIKIKIKQIHTKQKRCSVGNFNAILVAKVFDGFEQLFSRVYI